MRRTRSILHLLCAGITKREYWQGFICAYDFTIAALSNEHFLNDWKFCEPLGRPSVRHEFRTSVWTMDATGESESRDPVGSRLLDWSQRRGVFRGDQKLTLKKPCP